MPNPENIEPHKFKPGKTGNPDGRPVGKRNRSTIARELLSAVADMKDISPKNAELLNKYGIKTKGELEQLITAAQLIKAMSGDTKAYQALMDSGYGAPKQQTEVTNDGNLSIKIIRGNNDTTQRPPSGPEGNTADSEAV